jgi:hypothetical protein
MKSPDRHPWDNKILWAVVLILMIVTMAINTPALWAKPDINERFAVSSCSSCDPSGLNKVDNGDELVVPSGSSALVYISKYQGMYVNSKWLLKIKHGGTPGIDGKLVLDLAAGQTSCTFMVENKVQSAMDTFQVEKSCPLLADNVQLSITNTATSGSAKIDFVGLSPAGQY